MLSEPSHDEVDLDEVHFSLPNYGQFFFPFFFHFFFFLSSFSFLSFLSSFFFLSLFLLLPPSSSLRLVLFGIKGGNTIFSPLGKISGVFGS